MKKWRRCTAVFYNGSYLHDLIQCELPNDDHEIHRFHAIYNGEVFSCCWGDSKYEAVP